MVTIQTPGWYVLSIPFILDAAGRLKETVCFHPKPQRWEPLPKWRTTFLEMVNGSFFTWILPGSWRHFENLKHIFQERNQSLFFFSSFFLAWSCSASPANPKWRQTVYSNCRSITELWPIWNSSFQLFDRVLHLSWPCPWGHSPRNHFSKVRPKTHF